MEFNRKISKLLPDYLASDFLLENNIKPSNDSNNRKEVKKLLDLHSEGKIRIPHYIDDFIFSVKFPMKSDKRYTTRELMDMDLTICADFFAIPKDDRNFSERIFNILKYNNLIDDIREDVNDINEDGTETVKKSFGNIKCEDLNILRGLTFNINQLMCSTISGVNELNQFVEKRGEHFCHNISQKISSNLIRVAASRIFANPSQSILELPVNSVDSYRDLRGEKSSIGKFGMGFFSILYYLIGHPMRSLNISSTYLTEDNKY